jgi:hypothetical protein
MKKFDEIKLKLQQKIDNIIDCFDFNKVHEIMEHLNWTWATTSGRVPDVLDLKQCARKLLNDVVDNYINNRIYGDEKIHEFDVSTGGFKAELYYEILELSFILESWDEENILDKPKND